MPARTRIPLNQRHCISCIHYTFKCIGGIPMHMCRALWPKMVACQTQRSDTHGECKKSGQLYSPKVSLHKETR